MPAKRSETLGISAGKEFFAGSGQEKSAQWARGDRLPSDVPTFISTLTNLSSLVGVSIFDTFTTMSVSASFGLINGASVYFKPNYGHHLLFQTQWTIKAVSTGTLPSPLTTALIEIRAVLDGDFILLSGSGTANNWEVQLAHPGAINETIQIHQTFLGAFLNVSEVVDPEFHLLDFQVRLQSLPTGWSSVQVKPRMTLAFAVPSSQTGFTIT